MSEDQLSNLLKEIKMRFPTIRNAGVLHREGLVIASILDEGFSDMHFAALSSVSFSTGERLMMECRLGELELNISKSQDGLFIVSDLGEDLFLAFHIIDPQFDQFSFFKFLDIIKKKFLGITEGEEQSISNELGDLNDYIPEPVNQLFHEIPLFPEEIEILKHVETIIEGQLIPTDNLDTVVMGFSYERDHVTGLRLPNKKLDEIIDIIVDLPKLNSLGFYDVGLKTIPYNLSTLKQLERLILVGNELKSFDEVLNLPNLKHLYLNRNKLREFPSDIDKLKNLETLAAWYNEIEILPPTIGKLNKLKRLRLSGNKLESLPNQLRSLSELCELLLGNNKFQSFPSVICEMEQLITLNLDGNRISNIPNEIKNLQHLKILNLNRNQISSLPESFKNLGTLSILSLLGNNFSVIPKQLTQIDGLVSINLSQNNITDISVNELINNSLETLNLSHNFIEEIPRWLSSMDNVKILDLSSNRIKRVNEFRNLNKLEKLYLNDNEIDALPESIKELKLLHFLNLSNNHLSELPTSITKLTNIDTLILSSNELTNLPGDLKNWKNLRFLNLNNNLFVNIPYQIWVCKNLESFQIKKNDLRPGDKGILTRDLKAIIDYCRKKANIQIFISYAVADFNIFKIREISEYLEQHDEIYKALYCEEDLIDDIDNFMNKYVPESQILIFFASQISLNSTDCRHEIDLAKHLGVNIIPIKGNVEWRDLEIFEINRIKGFEFPKRYEEIDKLKQDLLEYILKFKQKANLMEREKIRANNVIHINKLVKEWLDDSIFSNYLLENRFILNEIKQQQDKRKISNIEPVKKLIDHYSKWLKNLQ